MRMTDYVWLRIYNDRLFGGDEDDRLCLAENLRLFGGDLDDRLCLAENLKRQTVWWR